MVWVARLGVECFRMKTFDAQEGACENHNSKKEDIMSNSFISCVMAVAFAGVGFVADPAALFERGALTVSTAVACDSACQVAAWQATRDPYKDRTAPRQVDTCVRILASDRYAMMSEVVLVAGADPQNGREITSLGRGNGFAYREPNQPAGTADVYVREFCFNGRLIDGLDTITFCNGMNPGDGNHHTLSLHDDSGALLRRLKETGQAGDYLSLLGSKRSYTAPVATFFTATRYQSRFGR